jgi:CHAD domain-containing protein
MWIELEPMSMAARRMALPCYPEVTAPDGRPPMTMSASSARRALARRASVLERDLPAVLDDDVEALHRSRVASRRLRELLPVLGLEGGLGRQAPARQIRRRLRRLTSALGGVRELDVALGILDDLARAQPGLDDALSPARRAVEVDRLECRGEMIRQLEDLRAGALFDELARLADEAGQSSPEGRARRLRRRLARRTDGLERAVFDVGSLFAIDRLHEVRIAVKKLRYVLESIHELGAAPTRRLVTRLKQFQDLLGRLHDLDVVAGYVRRHPAGPASFAPDARALALERIERDMRELHADYSRQAHLLDKVVAACRLDIDRRLAGPPLGAAPGTGSWPTRRASTSSGTPSRGSAARSTRTTRAAR